MPWRWGSQVKSVDIAFPRDGHALLLSPGPVEREARQMSDDILGRAQTQAALSSLSGVSVRRAVMSLNDMLMATEKRTLLWTAPRV
jgi:hypothetical protein